MLANNSAVVKVLLIFLTLIVCQSCDPYTTKRVPLGNYPYVNCKNCKKRPTVQGITQSQPAYGDYEYDFVGDEYSDKVQSKPTDKHAKHKQRHVMKSKKFVKQPEEQPQKKLLKKPIINRKGTNYAHGRVRTQNLIRDDHIHSNKRRRTNSGYIPLSKTPNKKYSSEKQRSMLARKNANIKKLSTRAKKVIRPRTRPHTLDIGKVATVPTQKGKSQLYDKLKELQNVEHEASDEDLMSHHEEDIPDHIQHDAMDHMQHKAIMPTHQETPHVQQPAAPRIQQPAAPRVQQPAAPRIQQPAAPRVQQPAAPRVQQPAAPHVQKPATQVHSQQKSSSDQQQQGLTKSKDSSHVAQYDLKNKPMPMLS